MAEPTAQEIDVDLSRRYGSGDAMDRFLCGLRKRRIEALHCSQRKRRYLPPHPFCGRPIYLDKVALTFPDLTIIGCHLGQPWHDHMIR